MATKRESLPFVGWDVEQRLVCQGAWDACGGPGVVLPSTRIAGGLAWPVVRWDEPVLRDRLLRGASAVVNRVRVRDWVVQASGEKLPLELVGFVFTGSLSAVRTPMSTLAPLGRMVWLSARVDDWSRWACELQGAWLVESTNHELVSRGSDPLELPADVGAVGRRLLGEQLFDLAAREDCLPLG
ncbi:hypothetical protein [Micropruina glycogenica]|uniref:Uncharacterized protein n=1 Tax=Micropruina glycogenica TaxID=75385 RepID=A0A2N9JGR0_9ACTN|nr:hypothetical protein [Micropruina glycogenica]SPD86708.1 protein of unknown function [Micropruina glycogenica]